MLMEISRVFFQLLFYWKMVIETVFLEVILADDGDI